MSGSKAKFAVWILLPLFLYLCLYTWNWKTGHLDRLASTTGLEAVGWIITPGEWIHRKSQGLWLDYIALWRVRQENKRLKSRLQELKIRQMRLASQAAEVQRLRELLGLSPPPGWSCTSARIVGERMGPVAALQTVVLDKGHIDAVHRNMPALTQDGLVGRVLETSPHFSKLLLITDPNSRIPVISSQERTKAILKGRGPKLPPALEYVPRNAALGEGDTMVTSGTGGIFPKGIPVARVSGTSQSEHSLFLQAKAQPLLKFRDLEEVLLLRRPGHKSPASFFAPPGSSPYSPLLFEDPAWSSPGQGGKQDP